MIASTHWASRLSTAAARPLESSPKELAMLSE
jgi:hypothetical protein